jgi:formate dehydrogenase beta subunit
VPDHMLGRDFSLAQLKEKGAQAVFLAVGAQASRRIPLAGCDLPDVLWGVEFLRDAASGKAVQLKKNVIVIGGGSVAVDTAMTALRCGAEDVCLACLEAESEMPAGAWEIETARAEGIRILPSRSPHRVVVQDGRVTGLDLVSCARVFDAGGNFCPRFDESSIDCLPVDQIILAVGQQTDLSFLAGQDSIQMQDGLIVVDKFSLQTGMPGVYAGGDAAVAPGGVIQAIAAGRRAAETVDRALGGSGEIDEVLFDRPRLNPCLGRKQGFCAWPRQAMPVRSREARRRGFAEIAIGFNADQARREAARCLQCDLRLSISCNPPPPRHVMAFNAENVAPVHETEGVYQLLDGGHRILAIKGTPHLRRSLLEALGNDSSARFFAFEEDKMFSKRESELIQKYLQRYGKMPGGGGDDELDDLF